MSDPCMEGYIKLYRKILECEVLKDKVFDRTHAWMDLLIMAKYETEEGLERGQILTSYRKLAERWGWDVHQVYRFIRQLEFAGMAIVENATHLSTPLSTPSSTLLTIVKYGFYQGSCNGIDNGIDNEIVNEVSRKRKETKEKEPTYNIKSKEENNRDSAESVFEELWSMYPRKEGKRDAYRHFLAALKDGTDPAEIRDGIERYVRKLEAEGTPTRYTMQGSTWFCQRRWTDEYEVTAKKQAPARSSKDYDTGVVETSFTKDMMTHGHVDYEALFGGDV